MTSNTISYNPPGPTTGATPNYTPTLTNTLNLTSSTARVTTYLRSNSSVSVGGQLDVKAAGAGVTTVNISLPVGSDFSNIYQAGGNAIALTGTGSIQGTIQANIASNTLELTYNALDTTTRTFMFTALYEII